jgi:hypothetical protein
MWQAVHRLFCVNKYAAFCLPKSKVVYFYFNLIFRHVIIIKALRVGVEGCWEPLHVQKSLLTQMHSWMSLKSASLRVCLLRVSSEIKERSKKVKAEKDAQKAVAKASGKTVSKNMPKGVGKGAARSTGR